MWEESATAADGWPPDIDLSSVSPSPRRDSSQHHLERHLSREPAPSKLRLQALPRRPPAAGGYSSRRNLPGTSSHPGPPPPRNVSRQRMPQVGSVRHLCEERLV